MFEKQLEFFRPRTWDSSVSAVPRPPEIPALSLCDDDFLSACQSICCLWWPSTPLVFIFFPPRELFIFVYLEQRRSRHTPRTKSTTFYGQNAIKSRLRFIIWKIWNAHAKCLRMFRPLPAANMQMNKHIYIYRKKIWQMPLLSTV